VALQLAFGGRLVHRLDRETSGALVVARTSDAAAWLSACFREHAESAGAAALAARSPTGSAPADRPATHPNPSVQGRYVSGEQHGKQRRSGRSPLRDGRSATALQSPATATGGAAVHRTYWAIVETGDVSGGALPAGGRIDSAIWGSGGGGSSNRDDPSGEGGSWRPAATVYSVLQQGGGYAWLELRPETGASCLLILSWRHRCARCRQAESRPWEPVEGGHSCASHALSSGQETSKASAEQGHADGAGRKHQIRIHCAQLGAPVVGDSRHGVTRGPAQDALADSVTPAARRMLKGRLMLHARSIRITRPRKLAARRSVGAAAVRAVSSKNSTTEVEAPVPEHFAALLQVLGFARSGDAV